MAILSDFKNSRLNILITYNDEEVFEDNIVRNSLMLRSISEEIPIGSARENAFRIAKSIAINSPENPDTNESVICFLKNGKISNYEGQHCVIWDHWSPEKLHERIDKGIEVFDKAYLGPFRPGKVRRAYSQRINIFLTDEDPDDYLKKLYGRIRKDFIYVAIYVRATSYDLKVKDLESGKFKTVLYGKFVINEKYQELGIDEEELMNHVNLIHTFIELSINY